MNINKLRIPLDILMPILSVILMGGTMLFPDDRVHQIFGIGLIILWAVHVVLNRRWYSSDEQDSPNAGISENLMQYLLSE